MKYYDAWKDLKGYIVNRLYQLNDRDDKDTYNELIRLEDYISYLEEEYE